uniref:Clp1 P-loop domain-containing protein n=1 Tax=Babesia bovis TaxID=5865 RepID=A7AT21_BABBO|eukprot:XP_001609650.1 hypothetical protein [Babesia bovis T2Bo]
MQGTMYHLNPAEVRRRRATFRLDKETLERRIDPAVVDTSVSAEVYTDIIALYPGECLTLHRGFHFRVLRGAVELNGHVYSPRKTSYTKVLIPPWVPPERMVALCSGDHGSPKWKHRECAQCLRIVTENFIGGGCCSTRSRVNEDGTLMEKHFGFPNPIGGYITDQTGLYREAVDYYDNERKTCRIYAARSLLQVCTKGDRPPVLMLHGDKSAGKSTAIAFIVNYLLNFVKTVALLDTDVGQPIFGAPGTISLKFIDQPINGQPHALVGGSRPDVSYLLGDVKVTKPSMLLRHVYHCFEIYSGAVGDDRTVPLLVNTFGWISGMGAKVLEAIAAITKTTIMLRLHSKHLNDSVAQHIYNHADLENVIKSNLEVTVDAPGHATDVSPEALVYKSIVEECGASLPWYKDESMIIDALSHSQASKLATKSALSLQEHSREEPCCNMSTWNRFKKVHQNESEIPTPNDLRWLRACALLNSAYGDAMHFPQLQMDEFFGGIRTVTFRRYIHFPKLFKLPRQYIMDVENSSFVLQINLPTGDIDEVCPFIAGSMVALCRGKCDHMLTNYISGDWEFICYVYVHYFNAENMTMLISHSQENSPSEFSDANIIVIW